MTSPRAGAALTGSGPRLTAAGCLVSFIALVKENRARVIVPPPNRSRPPAPNAPVVR
ncbi:MAG: hypothetical protein M0Z41_07205 [Peptococcaceae bacterium]|nr:hypothetical protein [Peptococcaceae bacterium]